MSSKLTLTTIHFNKKIKVKIFFSFFESNLKRLKLRANKD